MFNALKAKSTKFRKFYNTQEKIKWTSLSVNDPAVRRLEIPMFECASLINAVLASSQNKNSRMGVLILVRVKGL